MVKHVWPLIGGIVFLVEAMLDMAGQQGLYREQYRGLSILREWQHKRAFAEVIASAGCWILYFSPDEKTGYFVAGSAVFAAGLILCCAIDIGYKKRAGKIVPPNRQE